VRTQHFICLGAKLIGHVCSIGTEDFCFLRYRISPSCDHTFIAQLQRHRCHRRRRPYQRYNHGGSGMEWISFKECKLGSSVRGLLVSESTCFSSPPFPLLAIFDIYVIGTKQKSSCSPIAYRTTSGFSSVGADTKSDPTRIEIAGLSATPI
jgi:hypothetical protein